MDSFGGIEHGAEIHQGAGTARGTLLIRIADAVAIEAKYSILQGEMAGKKLLESGCFVSFHDNLSRVARGAVCGARMNSVLISGIVSSWGR
jgi:hypothetical protein